MGKISNRHFWFLPGLIFILVSVSCNLPFNTNNPTQTDPLDETATQGLPQTLEPGNNSQATIIPHTPEETVSPVTTPTDLAINEPYVLYRGFIALKNQNFIAYNFQGTELGFSVTSGPGTFYGENEVTVLSDSIVYTAFSDSFRVYQADQSGIRQLDFIGNTDPVSLAVSPDGTQIAWGTSTWIDNAPQTELFVANMDGSNVHLVDKILASEQKDAWLVFHPIRWTTDGRLVYGTGMTGIGGYLIFWGYNGLRVYDPPTDSIEILVGDKEMLGICLSGISDDLSKVAIVCDDASRAVRIRDLSSGNETLYEILPDQNGAGSVKFSPSGDWLAYVIQRMNPDSEHGYVVVVPTDGSIPPQILANNPGGTYHVNGWINEDTFLVTSYDGEGSGSVWRLNREGTDISWITDGYFVGLIP